jgi:hypothetical protein
MSHSRDSYSDWFTSARHLTTSMSSFSLAMTLFCMKQVQNAVMPPERGDTVSPAAKAADSLTNATVQQFGETLRSVFRAMDNAQRGFINVIFATCMPFTAMRRRSTRPPDDVDADVNNPESDGGSWSDNEPQRWTEVFESGTTLRMAGDDQE